MAETRLYSRQSGFSMDWAAVCSDLDQSLKRLGFTIPSFFVPLATLSGGNVQRMILAREMAHNPKLIIAFYPTRGLDVRSAVAARALLTASRDGGAGVLLISEDLGELFAMSDRLGLMNAGRLEQVGPPAHVYARPRTRFVAQFLGACNLIETAGPPRRVEPGLLRTPSPCGDLAVSSTDEPDPAALSDRGGLTLAIRPERVHLRPVGAEPRPNDVPVIVRHRLYTGSETQYTLHLARCF